MYIISQNVHGLLWFHVVENSTDIPPFIFGHPVPLESEKGFTLTDYVKYEANHDHTTSTSSSETFGQLV